MDAEVDADVDADVDAYVEAVVDTKVAAKVDVLKFLKNGCPKKGNFRLWLPKFIIENYSIMQKRIISKEKKTNQTCKVQLNCINQ